MKEMMLGVPKDGEGVELTEHRAMIMFPENAVEAEINVNVYHDGKIIRVQRKLDMDDLRTAFRKADDGYIDDDDRFVLTDKGIAWLEDNQK